MTLVVVFLLAAQHFHSGATPALEALPQDEDPVAVIKSILVNGAEKTDVPQSDMSVTRVTAEIRGGQAGMLLVPGDEIGTGANAKVTLLFLDAAPEKDNEVLVDSNARMRVGSILNLMGRVLVRSKGQFEAATQSVKLDETGAEYELVVQPDGTNRIRVLDGALRVTAPGAAPTPRRVRPRPQDSSVQGSTLAQELQQVILGPDGTLRRDRASQAELEETLNWSNEVIVAAQPSYSAQSIIPHMQSWQERAQQFRVARRNAVLNNDPDSYEALGRIYVDWGNGAKAVGELRKAVETFQTPERMTSLGEAYRLVGNWRNAHILLARTVRQYPDYAPALNTLGNVYFDQAKAAQDRKDYRTARVNLQNARQHYERAKVNSTAFIISESNIAETELALGDIAREQGRFDVAISQYKQAEQTFNQVERAAGNYPFPDKGLGDVYRGISAIARIQQDKASAQTYFSRSQEKYRQALQSHGDVSEAYVGLGRLYEDNGDKDKAIAAYGQAIRVRPEMPLAYYHYAVAIADRDPATAAAYARAYLKLERDVFKQGEKASNARAVAEPGPTPTPRPTSTTTVTPPPSPSPSPPVSAVKVPGVNGDKPEEALRKLRDRGLQGQLRDQPECKPSGKAVGTDPRKDTRVQLGTMVTVFISSLGDNAVTVPSVTNQSLSEAQRELRRLGLVVNAESRQETNAVPENTVVRQDPKANSRLNPGCAVELTTSIRVRLIEVPNYIGLSRQQALQRLSFGQLTRGRVTEVDSKAPPGTVIDQRPNPGEMVQPRTRVDLVISRSQSDYATVPDLRGRNLDQAKAMLGNSRLTLGQVSYKTAGPNQKVNTIISQSPGPFAKVVPGTPINVVIASYQID